MRNFLLLLVALFIFAESKSQGVAFGLKGGLNFPSAESIGTTDPSQVSSSTASGYHGGLFFRARFSKLAVQPEVLFSRQKHEFIFNDDVFGNIDVEQVISYVNIPVILKIYLAAGINVQVGPQFGFNINAEQTDTSLGAPTTSDFSSRLKGSDLGLNVGAGIDLPLGLQLTARYVLGLSDINDLAVPETKNSMFQLSIGYSLIDVGRD